MSALRKGEVKYSTLTCTCLLLKWWSRPERAYGRVPNLAAACKIDGTDITSTPTSTSISQAVPDRRPSIPGPVIIQSETTSHTRSHRSRNLALRQHTALRNQFHTRPCDHHRINNNRKARRRRRIADTKVQSSSSSSHTNPALDLPFARWQRKSIFEGAST